MRIQSPFAPWPTADEVAQTIDVVDRHIVITGGSAGLGAEMARTLAGAGAQLTLAVRNPAKAEPIAAQIRRDSGAHVAIEAVDLATPRSIADLVHRWQSPIDVLINNAGLMSPELRRNAMGWELLFGTHHLGHMALTLGLQPHLGTRGDGRIVMLSSAAHLRSPIDLQDLAWNTREYEMWTAYGHSKTANVLFAVEANRLWSTEGITVNAMHPGAIVTEIQREIGSPLDRGVDPTMLSSVTQGAATAVFLAGSPMVSGVGGRYFVDCTEAEIISPPQDTEPNAAVVADYAVDPNIAADLWQASLALLAQAPELDWLEH